MEVCTAREAAISGKKHFFTGKPCVRGHVAKRYVSCGICVECSRAARGVTRKLKVASNVASSRGREIAIISFSCTEKSKILDMLRLLGLDVMVPDRSKNSIHEALRGWTFFDPIDGRRIYSLDGKVTHVIHQDGRIDFTQGVDPASVPPEQLAPPPRTAAAEFRPVAIDSRK